MGKLHFLFFIYSYLFIINCSPTIFVAINDEKTRLVHTKKVS